MWRVIRLADPVGAHHFWACCGRWCSAAARRPAADDPVVFSNYKADFVVNARRPPRRRGDHHRRVPQRPPRHLPVLGRRQPEQPAGAAEARDHLDPARRRAGAVPDAVGGRRTVPGGQDRRSGPVPELRHPRLRDPLHASPACSTPAPPAPTRPSPTPTGDAADVAVGVLLERHRPVVEQHGSSSADISVTLPGDVTGAQCSVGFGVGRACRDLTVDGNTVDLSARHTWRRAPR